MNKVQPGSYIKDIMLGVLNEKVPLDVTILCEKEPNSSKFEILVNIENQTNQANVRKCVWENEAKEVRVDNLAVDDNWRLTANSEQRNYPIGKECLVCHCAVKCKKDCAFLKRYGGYAEE